MSKLFDYYREFNEEDYERLAWEREQLANEEWELSETTNEKIKYNGKRINEDRVYAGTMVAPCRL